jgi:hypothetical protein
VSVGTSRSKLSQDGNDSRIPYSCVVQVFSQCVPKVLRMVTIPGFLTWKDLYCLSIIFQNLNKKTSLK